MLLQIFIFTSETEEGFIKLFTRKADDFDSPHEQKESEMRPMEDKELDHTICETEVEDPLAPVVKNLRHLRKVCVSFNLLFLSFVLFKTSRSK